MQVLTNINLNQNELQNAVLQPLSTAPSAPKLGQIYCNSATKKIMWYNGTAWQSVGVVVTDSAVNGKITIDGVDMTVYELPKATATSLGGIKIGTGLSVDAATGIVSVSNEGMAVGSADKLTTPRKIALAGDATGEVSFDGSSDATITVTVKDDSHNHTIGNVDGLQTALNDKVSVETGKGLSTNDYTTAEKDKLSNIAAGAEVNVQSDWDATTGDALILNKPTALSEFTNDENFIDNTVNNLTNYYLKTETYTKDEINDIADAINSFDVQVVSTRPTENISTHTIYLVPKTGTTDDVYDEYLYIQSTSKWEMIGNTIINLSNYLTKTGNASDTTVTFTPAATRTALVTGEKLSVIIGKVAKYLADLKTVAFTGAYSDLTGKPTTLATQTKTIAAGSTSVAATVANMVSWNAFDGVSGEAVIVDCTKGAGDAYTFSIAKAYANAVNIIINYGV